MIIECGNVKIDTEKDHNAHKEAINSVTTMNCDKDKPRYWFTQIVGDEYVKNLRKNLNNMEVQDILDGVNIIDNELK